MSRVPYAYQQEAIDLGVERNLFLADGCGLGKKFTCLEVAKRIQSSLHLPTLVVTLKPDTYQWRREVLQDYPDTKLTIGTVDPIAVDEVPDWWLVLHYEALVRHSRSLSRVKFGTVVLDEGHHIKSPDAQRTAAARKLQSFRKIVATGTPMDKSPADLWSPINFLYPHKYGPYRAWKDTHQKSFFDTAGYERVLPGAKNPAVLGAILAPFYLARTKEQVAPQLPPNILKEQYLVMGRPQSVLYRRIQSSTDIEVPVPESDATLFIPSRMVQMLREQQAALDPVLIGSEAPSIKMEWLYNWLDSNPQEPTIIFTNYRSVAQRISRRLQSTGRPNHLIMGGVKLPDEWKHRTFVATIGAGSTALDLGFLHTAIFLDTHWSHLKMEQALNRIHRINNTHPVQTIFLLAQGSIDELFLTSFYNKWDQYDLVRRYATLMRDRAVRS